MTTGVQDCRSSISAAVFLILPRMLFIFDDISIIHAYSIIYDQVTNRMCSSVFLHQSNLFPFVCLVLHFSVKVIWFATQIRFLHNNYALTPSIITVSEIVLLNAFTADS